MTDERSFIAVLNAVSRSTLLIGGGALLLVLTLTISAATAPTIGTPTQNGQRGLTLVGSQVAGRDGTSTGASIC